MATLKWFLHSACNVLGYDQKNDTNNIKCNNNNVVVVENNMISSKMEATAVGFRMPLHYPRYRKTDYEKMEEWKLDVLLKEYGLSFNGSLEEKRAYAMGAFLWPGQY